MTRSSYGLDGGLEPNSQAAGFHTYTFQDAIDRAEDFVTSGGGNGQNRILKQSVLEAYDELCQAKDWQYFHRLYRVQVYAAVTGTCAYASSTRHSLLTLDHGLHGPLLEQRFALTQLTTLSASEPAAQLCSQMKTNARRLTLRPANRSRSFATIIACLLISWPCRSRLTNKSST